MVKHSLFPSVYPVTVIDLELELTEAELPELMELTEPSRAGCFRRWLKANIACKPSSLVADRAPVADELGWSLPTQSPIQGRLVLVIKRVFRAVLVLLDPIQTIDRFHVYLRHQACALTDPSTLASRRRTRTRSVYRHHGASPPVSSGPMPPLNRSRRNPSSSEHQASILDP